MSATLPSLREKRLPWWRNSTMNGALAWANVDAASIFLRCACLIVLFPFAACAMHPANMPNEVLAIRERVDDAPRVAIATAYAPELAALLPDLKAGEEHRLNGVSFWTGELSGQPVVLFATGVSMVNAAMNTQLLLDHFNISHIVVSGVAGGLDPALSVGDVTVPSSWAQYNEGAYLRETSPGVFTPHPGVEPILPPFEFMGTRAVRIARDADPRPEPKLWFDADPKLLALAQDVAGSVQLKQCDAQGLCLASVPRVVPGGRGVTGSTFMDNARFREYLFETFDAQVVEMETAAIAMVAYANDVPYIAFRSLSDLAGGGSAAQNEITAFEHLAAENAAILVHAYLQAYGAKTTASSTQASSASVSSTCEIHFATAPYEPKPLGDERAAKLRAYLDQPGASEDFLLRFERLSHRIAAALSADQTLGETGRIGLVWGGYNGSVDPSLTMTLDTPTQAERSLATRIGAGLGYVFFQQSVAVECGAPAEGLTAAPALVLQEDGQQDVLAVDTLNSVYGMMLGQDGGNIQQGFTYYPETDRFLVLDLTATGDKAKPVMDRVIADFRRFAPDAGLNLTETETWIRFPYNDWLVYAGGEKYIEAGLSANDLVALTQFRNEYLAVLDALPSPQTSE